VKPGVGRALEEGRKGMDSNRKRPYHVAGAGWIITALGAWVILAAVGGAVARAITGPTGPDARVPGPAGLDAYYVELVMAQLSFGVLTLACARAVMKGSRWARRASQTLMLVWAILLLVSGLWMTSWRPFGDRGEWSSILGLVWKGAAVLNALIFAALPALAAWLLGREVVRRWFEEH
jgi:hypothetical protein